MNAAEAARIALSIIWSIASIFTYAGTGTVPEWMLGLTMTTVGGFFVSSERAKVIQQRLDKKKAENRERSKPSTSNSS